MVSVLINRPSNKSTDKHISERLNVKTDYVIENDSTLEAYREKVLELMRKII
jgi:dephospho-CoA kinase